jgi:hypothetical protein
LSELGEALMERMGHIVFLENRPFSYLDFIPEFEVDGKEYSIGYGTLRNQFSKLRRKGEIEIEFRTKQAFYTIKGHKFGKQKLMTSNPMGVSPLSHDPISKLIARLPFGNNALHDIHLRFEVKGIWTVLSINSALRIGAVNKDLRLPTLKVKELQIKVTIHKSDTVSVVVGCSYAPIAVDCTGIIRLSNALTRVEEKISRLVERCNDTRTENRIDSCNGNLLIPEHTSWIVTMWHFGLDSITEYTGEKFSATWEVGQNALIRAYSKDMKVQGTKVRLERQENPNKTFEEAIEEKLRGS